MKKYLRYKNFLPLDYIEKKKLKESKENKKSKTCKNVSKIITLSLLSCIYNLNLFIKNFHNL